MQTEYLNEALTDRPHAGPAYVPADDPLQPVAPHAELDEWAGRHADHATALYADSAQHEQRRQRIKLVGRCLLAVAAVLTIALCIRCAVRSLAPPVYDAPEQATGAARFLPQVGPLAVPKKGVK